MKQEFTHVALSVPREIFDHQFIESVLSFYSEVFGWNKIEEYSIENERLILDIFHSETDKYLNIRARDDSMVTTGYEHLGFSVTERKDIDVLYKRSLDYQKRDSRVELSNLEARETYYSFRVRYLLPLSIEVQYWSNA